MDVEERREANDLWFGSLRPLDDGVTYVLCPGCQWEISEDEMEDHVCVQEPLDG